MIILDCAAAFVIGILSGLGVGSGGLLVVYLTLVRSVEQIEAQITNIFFFVFAAGASLVVHLRKRKLEYDALFTVILAGALFAVLGNIVSSKISTELLRRCFGIFSVFSGAVVLLRECKKLKRKCKGGKAKAYDEDRRI